MTNVASKEHTFARKLNICQESCTTSRALCGKFWTLWTNTKKPKKQKTTIFRESWLGPPLPESLGILFFFCCFFCFFGFLKVFGLPRSKSLQILPCLLPGSGDPNDHAYGSAVYVVKSRPIANAKNLKNCTPRSCRSVLFWAVSELKTVNQNRFGATERKTWQVSRGDSELEQELLHVLPETQLGLLLGSYFLNSVHLPWRFGALGGSHQISRQVFGAQVGCAFKPNATRNKKLLGATRGPWPYC